MDSRVYFLPISGILPRLRPRAVQTNTCSRCPAHTGWVASRLGPEKWRPPARGSAPRRDRPGRTSRRLNHHGQLTGFPRPARSRWRTPREPLVRMISTCWRDAMWFTVYTPRDPNCDHRSTIFRQSGLQESITCLLALTSGLLRCHRILRIRRRDLAENFVPRPFVFSPGPAPSLSPPWLGRSC